MHALPEMPCHEIVAVMTEYLEGTLPELDRTRFEEHLAICDPCRTYLAQMRAMIGVLGRIDERSLPPEEQDQLLALFRDWKGDSA
jgi:anti-sigma factor RsiW